LSAFALVTVGVTPAVFGEAVAPGSGETQLVPPPPPPLSTLKPVSPPTKGAEPSPPATPGPVPVPSDDWLSQWFGQRMEAESGLRLAGTPNMFGDIFPSSGGATVDIGGLVGTASASLPLAGGCRRVKVGENNQPLTQDRVYFLYNHFHHALEADATGMLYDPRWQSFSVDRYTVGLERTFLGRRWSVELRMPFSNGMEFVTTDFAVSSGSVGNLAILLKRMLYRSDTTAIAAGLGIDTPTGSDVWGYANPTSFTMHNQAVHLMPFVGLLQAPTDRLFYQCFLQVDVPTNGNRIDYSDPIAGTGSFGTLNEQTLLYVDMSLGYWLFRDRTGAMLRGLAWLLELHYTTTLQDTDSVFGMPSSTTFVFENPANRLDILNLTVGLHADLGRQTLLRVGGVFPLRSGYNRSFDAEVQVQLERRF